ncbi:PBP/GOBP family domain-containing protein [Phthorimaea operculella]|nr:PBP/GOBP family domain-containing protein [Phthorimaea operculella]
MKVKQKRHERKVEQEKMSLFTKFATVILFLLFTTAFYLVMSFSPMTKEDQIASYKKMNDQVEPFRKNISECARQVKASMVDVENFLKRIPQSSMQGKCFVACILKRNSLIKYNKIVLDNLIETNRAVYDDDSEVLSRLKTAGTECLKVVDGIFEICEYASMFNDCMHMKMEHLLDKLTMERRMEALGQMTSDPEQWTEEDDELLKLVKDEL